MSERKVKNPKTGRKMLINGPTYMRLVRNGDISSDYGHDQFQEDESIELPEEEEEETVVDQVVEAVTEQPEGDDDLSAYQTLTIEELQDIMENARKELEIRNM